jgi:FLYWCH zinc finger domain
MHFKKSSRGSTILQHQGHEFYRKRELRNGCVLWKCKMYEKCRCSARITTCHGTITDQKNAIHNHKAGGANSHYTHLSNTEEDTQYEADSEYDSSSDADTDADMESENDIDTDDEDEDNEEEEGDDNDQEEDREEEEREEEEDDDDDDDMDDDESDSESDSESDNDSGVEIRKLKPGVYCYYPKFLYV